MMFISGIAWYYGDNDFIMRIFNFGRLSFHPIPAYHVIGLQDERSLMKANVLDTALANGRSSVFSSTGKAAYRFSDVLLYV